MSESERGRKLLGLLGLAMRSGTLAVGTTAVKQMVSRGKNPILILARDAGDGQLIRIRRLEPVAGIVDDVLDRADLAAALGRNDLVVVGVADPGFVHGIRKIITGS